MDTSIYYMMNRDSIEEFVDFAIITALPVERDALLKQFDEYQKIQNEKVDFRTYYLGCISTTKSNRKYSIVLVMLPGMGNLESLSASHDILDIWKPKHILVIGIAGGNEEKGIKIGDIVVSNSILYYELGKYKEHELEFRFKSFNVSPLLYDRIINFKIGDDWCSKVHFGVIASGEKVISQDCFRWELLSKMPQILAFEMESAGVASGICHKYGDNFIAIRAISDFANQAKNDDSRVSAANNAAIFLKKWLLEEPIESIYKSKIELGEIYNSVIQNIDNTKNIDNLSSREAINILNLPLKQYLNKMKREYKQMLPNSFIGRDIHVAFFTKDQFVEPNYFFSTFSGFSNARLNKISVIIGIAGSGKSALLFKRFLKSLENCIRGNEYDCSTEKKIPILIPSNEIIRLGPIKSIAHRIEPFIEGKNDIYYKKLIEKGVFEILIDEAEPNATNILRQDKRENLSTLEKYLKYYLDHDNRIVTNCRPYSYLISDLFNSLAVDYYWLHLPTEEQIYKELKTNMQLLPTDLTDSTLGMLRVPLFFSIYTKLIKQDNMNFDIKTRLLEYYINDVIEGVVNSCNGEISRNELIDLLSGIAISLKENDDLLFNKFDLLIFNKNLSYNNIVKILSSSLFQYDDIYGTKFIHNYMQDYFISLNVRKKEDLEKYWDLYLSNPQYWLDVIIFTCGFSKSEDIIPRLIDSYREKQDIRFLFHAILCAQEVRKESVRESYMKIIVDEIINSIEMPDENFYLWLPEIMNSMMTVSDQIIELKLLEYIKDNINSLTPKMVNILHYSPHLLKRYEKLSKDLINKLIEGSDDYHLLFSIIEVLRLANRSDLIDVLVDLYSDNNPILRSQIIFTLEYFGNSEAIKSIQQKYYPDTDDVKSVLKNELKSFYNHSDPFMIGHAIIEILRLDPDEDTLFDISKVMKKDNSIIRYHVLYGAQFASVELRNKIRYLIKIHEKGDNQ